MNPAYHPRAVAPYHDDPIEAAQQCFDRETGESVSLHFLKSYRETLAQYHLHPEDKFDGGDYTDSGITRRKHIVVNSIERIGKEANRWEEQFFLGADSEAQIVYGATPEEVQTQWYAILRESRNFKMRQLARASTLDVAEISRLLSGKHVKPTQVTIQKLQAGIAALKGEQDERERIIKAVKEQCQTMTVREFARRAGVDYTCLCRVLAGRRRLGNGMLKMLADCSIDFGNCHYSIVQGGIL